MKKKGARPARRRWSRDAVAAQIRAYAAEGRPLNMSAVTGFDSGLTTAAYDLFGSWDAALRAGGIEPDSVRLKPVGRRWTKESIVAGIRAYAAEGRDLASFAVQGYDKGLNLAAFKLCGSWNAALIAAGIDPGSVRKMEEWTGEKVVARIREHAAAGRDVASAAVQKHDNKLAKAAASHFGSWHAALAAAGLDADGIRKVRRWNKAGILAAIREHAKAGRDLALSAVMDYDHRLYWATFRMFGGWAEALEAAGFDPEASRRDLGTQQHRGTVFENIIREPLAKALGWRTDYCFFREDGTGCWPDLYDPATGEWADLKIHSWGFSVAKSIEGYARYAPSLLIIHAEGRARAPEGNVRFVNVDEYRGLVSTAAWRHAFARIDELRASPAIIPPALAEFMVPRAPWSDMRWTRELVLQRILEYRAQGADLSSGGVRKYDEALQRAAMNRFGTWDGALAAAGLAVQETRKIRAWSDDDVTAEIRKLHGSGVSMRPGHSGQHHHALYELARRRFGSWDDAVRRAGVAPVRVRPRRPRRNAGR